MRPTAVVAGEVVATTESERGRRVSPTALFEAAQMDIDLLFRVDELIGIGFAVIVAIARAWSEGYLRDYFYALQSRHRYMGVTNWEDPTRVDELDGGGERRVLAHSEDMMLVHYSLEEGDEGALHSHQQTVQASFVIEGSLELLGEYSSTVEACDSYVIPPGVTHGVRAKESCRVIDAFSPPLEEYKPE